MSISRGLVCRPSVGALPRPSNQETTLQATLDTPALAEAPTAGRWSGRDEARGEFQRAAGLTRNARQRARLEARAVVCRR